MIELKVKINIVAPTIPSSLETRSQTHYIIFFSYLARWRIFTYFFLSKVCLFQCTHNTPTSNDIKQFELKQNNNHRHTMNM